MLTPAPNWLVERPIAHRGLHDRNQGRAENSISAFQAAIDSGYAIECDVQVSKTGEPVVFHDPVLGRMTGLDGEVKDFSPAELADFKLLETDDTIRTLHEHLELVSGKVPLVIELKGLEKGDHGFVEGVAKALKGYAGQVAVMSFDYWICDQFAELMPQVPRGLTAEGGADVAAAHLEAMKVFDLQFVSYDVNELPTPFVADMHAAGLPVITWTVRTDAQAKATYTHADQITFEGFMPPKEQNRHNYA